MQTMQFLGKIHDVFAKGYSLIQSKNQDYAGEADPFRNFRFAEYVNLTVVQAVLLRISDKFARVCNLLSKENGPAVADEKVTDTILDMINYLAILLVYLENIESMNHTEDKYEPSEDLLPEDVPVNTL